MRHVSLPLSCPHAQPVSRSAMPRAPAYTTFGVGRGPSCCGPFGREPSQGAPCPFLRSSLAGVPHRLSHGVSLSWAGGARSPFLEQVSPPVPRACRRTPRLVQGIRALTLET